MLEGESNFLKEGIAKKLQKNAVFPSIKRE